MAALVSVQVSSGGKTCSDSRRALFALQDRWPRRSDRSSRSPTRRTVRILSHPDPAQNDSCSRREKHDVFLSSSRKFDVVDFVAMDSDESLTSKNHPEGILRQNIEKIHWLESRCLLEHRRTGPFFAVKSTHWLTFGEFL